MSPSFLNTNPHDRIHARLIDLVELPTFSRRAGERQ